MSFKNHSPFLVPLEMSYWGQSPLGHFCPVWDFLAVQAKRATDKLSL